MNHHDVTMPRSFSRTSDKRSVDDELEREPSIKKQPITYTRSTSKKRHDTIATEDEENTFLGKSPAKVVCHFCCEEVRTITEEKSSKEMYSKDDWCMNNCGYVTMFICAPIWLFIPCVYLMKRKPWKMTTHTCPNCNVYIGVHSAGKTRLFRKPGPPENQFAELKYRRKERRTSL